MQEESQIWEGSPSQVLNLSAFASATLLCWLILPIPWAFWRYLEIRCTRYNLSNERLTIETGVLSKRAEELELYRVKDTTFHQPLVLRIFGLGNVVLRTSDRSHPTVTIRAVPDARSLRENIRGAVEKMRDRKRVRELDM